MESNQHRTRHYLAHLAKRDFLFVTDVVFHQLAAPTPFIFRRATIEQRPLSGEIRASFTFITWRNGNSRHAAAGNYLEPDVWNLRDFR
jgi:hypothetical protein